MKNLAPRLLFNIFKIILAVLPLAIWIWYFEFEHISWLSKLTSFIFLLTIVLLLEATRHPGDNSTPFYRMIGRLPTLRDRLVSLIALVVFFVLLCLPLLLTFTWQINWVMVGFAAASYYVISIIFGTQELRNSLKPKWPEIW